MDPETNAKMVYMMGPFIKKFNGIHLNKLLDIQGKESNDLPMMPEHRDEEKKRAACATARYLVSA